MQQHEPRIDRGGTHRPWPRPAAPPVMRMTWSELLFVHWECSPRLLASQLPPGLELDTCDGRAWVGVVPFRMRGVRLEGWPALGWAEDFPELNLRTYVRCGGRAGVWFFSLDAASPLAVAGARAWFHLPYFIARMSCTTLADGSTRYASERRHSGAPSAELVARYAPTSAPRRAERGSLEHFLVERYCLYSRAPNGGLLCGEIDHAPWPIQDARVEFERNSLGRAAGFELAPEPALAHYVRALDVTAWAPAPVA